MLEILPRMNDKHLKDVPYQRGKIRPMKNWFLKWWKFCLGLVISIVFVYAAASKLEWEDFFLAIRTANYWWLIPGVGMYMIGLWVRLLRIPYSFFFPLILLICMIGGYAVRHTVVDLSLMLIFGVVGYLFRKFEYEPAPLILAFVLSGIFDETMRQSLILSRGSFTIFFTRPIACGCLIFAALILGTGIYASLKTYKRGLNGR